MAQKAEKAKRFKWGQDQKKLTAAAARRLLSPEDKKALPFLGKKCTDQNSPDYGKWQEDRIVHHIVSRLMLSDTERRNRVQRMQEIDIQLSGVVNIKNEEKAERKRDRENKLGRPASPTKHNLPLAYSQIDDCVTYCMSLFAPEMNIFIATSTARKQAVAEGLTREIGKHGQTLQYYRNFSKFVLNAIKYNLGALSVKWEKCEGTIFSADNANEPTGITGQLTTKKGTVWEGNVLKSCDMYNFLYDTSVHPVDLPLRGEYFAEVELKTAFHVKRMKQQKILFGIERYINSVAPIATSSNSTFYITPPDIREKQLASDTGNRTNFQQILSVGNPASQSTLGIELVWYTTWIIPSEYAISDSDELELWCLCMANGQFITSAFQIDVSHGQLPVAAAAPIEDDCENNQRTYAEMLFPLQHFASFLMNTHVEATRKALYGITVYDKNAFPGLDLDTEDLIGARIPMKSTAQGVTIDQMFRHYNEAPQTDQNVQMIANIVDLMQKILPTNMANQVADLQRATEYQAAATVQASSRRNLKIARTINDQALTPVKFQMMYNIYENVNLIEYTGADGSIQKITPKDLLDAQIEFDVGTGLKGMDRLMQVSIFKDLMSYLFQVKGMDQQVDLLGLLSYVTQIAGFETDLTQFRLATPQQAQQQQAQAENPQQQQSGAPAQIQQ